MQFKSILQQQLQKHFHTYMITKTKNKFFQTSKTQTKFQEKIRKMNCRLTRAPDSKWLSYLIHLLNIGGTNQEETLKQELVFCQKALEHNTRAYGMPLRPSTTDFMPNADFSILIHILCFYKWDKWLIWLDNYTNRIIDIYITPAI